MFSTKIVKSFRQWKNEITIWRTSLPWSEALTVRQAGSRVCKTLKCQMANREKSGDEQFPLKPAWGVTCSNFNLICRSSWSSQSSSWNVKCVTGEIFTSHPGCQMLRQGHLMSEICLIVTTRHFYHRQPNWTQRYFEDGKMLIFFLRL